MSEEHCSMPSMDGMSSMQDEAPLASDQSDKSDTPNTPANNPTSKHAQMPEGDACGYCSLLAHLPVIPGVETLFVVAVRVRQHTVATRFENVRRAEPLTFAQPRAPPFTA
jgi:hypothetical protein